MADEGLVGAHINGGSPFGGSCGGPAACHLPIASPFAPRAPPVVSIAVALPLAASLLI